MQHDWTSILALLTVVIVLTVLFTLTATGDLGSVPSTGPPSQQ